MTDNKFKMYKVFDCQDMPSTVRKVFFETSSGPGNDCFISLYVYPSHKIVDKKEEDLFPNEYMGKLTNGDFIKDVWEDGLRKVIQRGDDIVSDWLYDNGADISEEILIKHWW